MEHYLHQVFSRIAAQGNYVAWVSHDDSLLRWKRGRRERVVHVDGIHVARIGLKRFYPRAIRTLLERLAKKRDSALSYDVVIECVHGEPLGVAEYCDYPVVPIVFDLSTRTRISSDIQGPIVATSQTIRVKLTPAGANQTSVSLAPFAPDDDVESGFHDGRSHPFVVVVDQTPTLGLHAVKKAFELDARPQLDFFGKSGVLTWRGRSNVVVRNVPWAQNAEFYRGALFVYCGPGYEYEAIRAEALGVPVICPASELGSEFTGHGECGMTFRAGDREGLIHCMTRIATDEVFRRRITQKATERSQGSCWDTTAEAVNQAIEFSIRHYR